MKRRIFHAVAGALLLSGAGVSSAAQQLICDQPPTSSSTVSCRFSEVPVTSSPSGSTYYIVEPAPAERTVVREPAVRERVVVQEPAASTPVDAVVMSYPVDDAFPDPNPRQEAQQRVYIPREPVRMTERGFFGEVTPD